MAKARVCVVGSYNTDLMTRTVRMPAAGETVMGHSFRLGPGGKGSNQAVAAARLGAEVSFVGKIGRDEFGEDALAFLTREGIDTSMLLRTEASHTGTAHIIVDDRGENLIVVSPGANMLLCPEEVDAAADVIAMADVVLCQLEVPLETTARAMRLAKSGKAKVILNPAPALPLEDSLLALADILTPNETEAEAIAALPVRGMDQAVRAAAALAGRGAGSVVITLGPQGALVYAARDSKLIQARKVEALDTAGAGDSFSGALAVAVAEGQPLLNAVRFAILAASLAVTRVGTAPSMPWRHEVDALLP